MEYYFPELTEPIAETKIPSDQGLFSLQTTTSVFPVEYSWMSARMFLATPNSALTNYISLSTSYL